MATMIGEGATISVDDGSGGGSTSLIIDIINLTVPDAEVGVVVSKRLNLPSRTLIKISSLLDPGTFTFQYEYDKGKKKRLDALLGASHNFTVTLPDTWSRVAPGFISKNEMDKVEADQIATATATVVVTGPTTGD